MNKRTILVTGGAGYIGSELVRLLLENGNKVLVLDKFLYEKNSLYDVLDKIDVIEGDVRDKETVRKAMHNVNVVVHLAELVGDPICSTCPELAHSVNYGGTTTVAHAAKEAGVEQFIYMSSCSVYGFDSSGELLTEDSSLNPVSLYAELKIQSEQYLKRLSTDEFKPTILRLSTVYGLSHRPRFDLVVNLFTAQAVIDRKITIMGGGSWRPFVSVHNVGRAICSVLDSDPENTANKIFNICPNNGNKTIANLGGLVKSLIPGTVVEVIEKSDADRRSYKVDGSMFLKTVGDVLLDDMTASILEIKQYLETNPSYNNDKHSNLSAVKAMGCSI